MTPQEFIDKWARVERTERQTAQEHFIDLCRMLGEETPNEAADPDSYAFERGASKTDGRAGFADVWKRGHFGWEYKKDRANLDRAYQQLQLYSVALEQPPLLVVSDTKRFRVYTNWTNTVQEKHDFVLEDIAHTATRELLRNVFRHPDRLQPKKTREQVTKDAAKDFSTIAERLRMAGHAPEKVAHFLNRLVFCLFAEDVNLLQDDLFKRLLDTLAKRREQAPERSQRMLSELFANMRQGGEYGLEHILHFNGGLFDTDEALPLDPDSLDILRTIARQDWSAIDPSIFGTLFERFLDPDKRAQIGAHYTDAGKIMMIVEPVILRPLNAEWDAVKAELAETLAKGRRRDGTPGPRALAVAEERLDTFLKRLADVRVLDPACGSGNFLYMALQSLKDFEYRVILDAETMGLARRVVHCGPRNVKGIEINPYAAELARTSIWIGNIQWLRRNGFEARKEPVLEDLEAIECRDALVTRVSPLSAGGEREQSAPHPQPSPAGLSRGSTSSLPAAVRKQDVDGRDEPGHDEEDGVGSGGATRTPDAPGTEPDAARPRASGDPVFASESLDSRLRGNERQKWVEAEWPEAEFIVGNPPFLGDKLMIAGLGELYANELRRVFRDRVPGGADLVTYWFEKARAQLLAERCKRVGLVSTNSIRGGANRSLLETIKKEACIFDVWSDEPWIIDGASVRVSIVCFAKISQDDIRLDGISVDTINADLTSQPVDLTKKWPLIENAATAFIGTQKGGAFEITGSVARDWLRAPLNTNGRSNDEVVRPWVNGMDIVRRPSDTWIVDFGVELSEAESAHFQAPFEYIHEIVRPSRLTVRRDGHRRYWWRHAEARPGLRTALRPLRRFFVTPRVAKHRLFVALHKNVVPDTRLVVVARDDDTSYGILLSRFHEAWSLRTCSWHGVGNDPTYNAISCFETFPFPNGLTPNIPAADYADDPRAIVIAKAAKRLDELRSAWLNPPDLIDIVPEVYPTAEMLAAGAEKIYPDRILPKNEAAGAELKRRTLTNLYNARPQWLADAHRDLDAAVAAAYGWPADISEEDALARLLELNLARAGAPSPPLPEQKQKAPPAATPAMLTPEQFAKISEIEGLTLTPEMERMFAEFEKTGVSAAERRQAIIDRFKAVAR